MTSAYVPEPQKFMTSSISTEQQIIYTEIYGTSLMAICKLEASL